MAHYAFLDNDNIVTEVIVGVDEDVVQTDTDGTEVGGSSEAWETFYGNARGQTCKRTSYNTSGGINSTGGTPFRKNYAGIGYTFRSDLNGEEGAFVQPQPYPSWLINEETCLWESPVPYPTDGKQYGWFEPNQEWIEITGAN